MICETCSTSHDGTYGRGRFCSETCSRKAQLRRISDWRKARKKPCPECGKLIYPEASTCRSCCKAWSRGDLTLGEAIYQTHHKSSAFALVRSRARAVIRRLGWVSCWVCGYNKHVDAAHLRDISAFSHDTRISVINDPQNLAALCRNHHWEFDHDLLKEKMAPPAGVEPASMA